MNTYPREDNRHPFQTSDDFVVVEAAPGAFDGGTENARGDHDGTSDPTTLFTVTGDVLVQVFGVCTTTLTGASATIEVGTANNTAALIAQTTGTDIDAGDIWATATPSAEVEALSDVTGPFVIADGADVIETISTANITAGEIYYVCMYRPLTAGSDVVSAV